eukprot:jgi/Tetstr1/432959/TSEL_022296.t1
MASAVKSSSNPQPSYAEKTVPHRHGHSGPELLASVPDPSLPNYIARFDANDLSRSFAQVGIASLEPRTSCLGVGTTVKPGTVAMAVRDGELYAMLPGIHAWRTHALQPKPYKTLGNAICFTETELAGNGTNGRQDFEGGIVLTLGPNEIGFAYNVPGEGGASSDWGSGVRLIPPGSWILRSPIIVARSNFEVTTAGQTKPGGVTSYIQEVQVGLMDIAKPRLVYVPYNHTAMFIDGNDSVIADQGFHWASPGIEICGPWAQHELQFTYLVNARTLDNMQITIEMECWTQMVNPERYVNVAGKDRDPELFVKDKLTAKAKQHVAQINALQVRSAEESNPGSAAAAALGAEAVGMPVAAAGAAAAGGLASFDGFTAEVDGDEIMVTAPDAEALSETEVFSRIQSLLHDVRGFVDGRSATVASLASQVQDAILHAGLSLKSLAALSVNLPQEITSQIQQANEEQIIAQTEQATNHAKAQKHIAAKYAEIRKKKADRDEETKDAENQITLQRTKARLAEAEEFAKRQAKRAEQKVEQALELQALEHKMVREEARIENELRLLVKEASLIAKQEEIETQRLRLARKVQERENLEADVAAYKVTTEARAARERVNQQTLVEAVMRGLGQPLGGSKVVTINNGGGGGGGNGQGEGSGGMGMLPQIIAMKEILGHSETMCAGVHKRSS